MTEAEIRRDERERMAQLLLKRSEEFPGGGPERACFMMAATAVRRGRLLTAGEALENLKAAVDDKPAPYPAPKAAE